MDIHAPMEPIHSWRDIALHLGIMTVGLFIALSLEGLVEHFHNRHLVSEARANIRQEIQDNQTAAQDDLVLLQKDIGVEKANIVAIQGLKKDPKNFHGSVNNSRSFEDMHDAAWRTARDTGALSFMPYDEVQRYSELYRLEGIVNDWDIKVDQSELISAAPFFIEESPGELPPAEYDQMLRANATIEMQLFGLRQQVQQFDNQCVAELKK